MKKRAWHLLWIVPLGAGLLYVLVLAGYRAEPGGYVASHSIYQHEKNDVLDFSHGKVTLRTCCGDMPWGTYAFVPSKGWVWNMHREKAPWTHAFLVDAGMFSMTFTDAEDPSYHFTLKRRVFRQLPL